MLLLLLLSLLFLLKRVTMIYYLKKKDFLPIVPKSLWSGQGLNLGPSSFLPIYLTTKHALH